MARVAVAGLSARLAAEWVASLGHEVLALDLFGDEDTRRAAVLGWRFVGGEGLRLDEEKLLTALRESEVEAWIAASGFEAQPDLLAAAARLKPLLGTPPEEAARLRDPALFFGFLDACDIEHPPWGTTVGHDDGVWLRKNARACGGAHVERVAVDTALPSQHHYFQREIAGAAMSATFIVESGVVTLLGINEQFMAPDSFAFRGLIGPVAVPELLARKVSAIVERIAGAFHLRGPGSLDFIRTGPKSLSVLEVNARVPASLALYPAVPNEMRGVEIVFARRAGLIERSLAAPGVHDLPQPGTHVAAGDPLCSVSASGPDAATVRERLAAMRDNILSETFPHV